MTTIRNIELTTCESCHGSKLDDHHRMWVGIDSDGNDMREPSDANKVEDTRRQREPISTCYTCNGHGVTKKGYYGSAYKTAASARAAVTRNVAVTCRTCRGSKRSQEVPVQAACYRCSGTGQQPGAYVPPPAGTVITIPRQYRTDNASREFMVGWLANVPIHVGRQDRAGTWNEHHLGLGSIVSVTDYGDAWNANNDVTLAGKVYEMLLTSSRPQFCKISDKDTGALAAGILITVHRHGYTVTAIGITELMPMLPPTYTAELLNRPIV